MQGEGSLYGPGKETGGDQQTLVGTGAGSQQLLNGCTGRVKESLQAENSVNDAAEGNGHMLQVSHTESLLKGLATSDIAEASTGQASKAVRKQRSGKAVEPSESDDFLVMHDLKLGNRAKRFVQMSFFVPMEKLQQQCRMKETRMYAIM